MLLAYETTIQLNNAQSNIVGHMCYAAYKLWNVCNYERKHYKELDLPVEFPNWYYQKKAHKGDLWYQQLPSQTAQEVCKQLDKSWLSFFKLNQTHGIENPRPPKFKHEGIAITYMQKGIVHEQGSSKVRLTLSKSLKKYMADTYGIRDNFLYIENPVFNTLDVIKQIKIYPPSDGEARVIIDYEIPDVEMLADNHKYLSVDEGIHNLMTCYNSATGETFILGRLLQDLCRWYNKEIARVQSQWYKQQKAKGVRYPKSSKHIRQLYAKKKNVVRDYIHKLTKYIVNYCKANNIHTVVCGDITGIRKNNDKGSVVNQKLHSLPYRKLHAMLKYKLALEGINFVLQKEAYSSQTSPLSPSVGKKYARKENRVNRGLYRDGDYFWNADCVGAFNILRLYLKHMKIDMVLDPMSIKVPYVVKVAV